MRAVLTIGVLGSGAWGTALAQALARGGHVVRVWSIEPSHLASINTHHTHGHYADVVLHPNLSATLDLKDLEGCSLLINAVSAQAVRAVGEQVAKVLRPVPMILCSKGIEQQTHRLMTEVCAEVCPTFPVAVLSGPTFADDVIRGRPVAFDLACKEASLGQMIVEAVSYSGFNAHLSLDPVGAQLGGALKNVMALACGVAMGLGAGESFRARLLTLALAEMAALGGKMGADPKTFYGLSGLGDLTLTCTGPLSRNLSLGLDLGQGLTFAQAIANRGGAVAEGVYTCQSAVALGKKYGVDMPLVSFVDQILNHQADPQQAFQKIL